MKRVLIVLGFLCMTLTSYSQADWRYKLEVYGSNTICPTFPDFGKDHRAYFRLGKDFYGTTSNSDPGCSIIGPFGFSDYVCCSWVANNTDIDDYPEEIIKDIYSTCNTADYSTGNTFISSQGKKPTKIYTTTRSGDDKWFQINNGYSGPVACTTDITFPGILEGKPDSYYINKFNVIPARNSNLNNHARHGQMNIHYFECEPIISPTASANNFDSIKPVNDIVCSEDYTTIYARTGYSSYIWQYYCGIDIFAFPATFPLWTTIPNQTSDSLHVNYNDLTLLQTLPNNGYGRGVWFRCLVDGQPTPSRDAVTKIPVKFYKAAPKVINYTSTNTSCYYSKDGEATIYFDRALLPTEVIQLTLSGFIDTSGKGLPSVNFFIGNKVFNAGQLGPNNSVVWNNLAPGKYTIKIEGYLTDTFNYLCDKKDYIFIIGRPSKVDFSLANYDLTCFQKNDGNITVSATGGNGGFTYSNNNGAYQSSNVFSNLPIGNYNIIVKDSKGCFINPPNEVIHKSTSLSQPTKLKIILDDIHDALGWGRSDGFVHVSGIDGTPPYTYSWSNGSTQAKNNGLASGTYTVTVKDKNNCSEDSFYLINQPDPLVADVDTLDYILCHSDHNGSLIVKTIGGVPPYTYLWNTNDTDSIVRGLPTGKYSVTVTDSNLNVTYATIYLGEPDTLDITEIITPASCLETPTGAIDITPSGGTAPYTYSWIYGQTTEDISELLAGNYFVTMRDANECIYEKSFSVVSPNALNAEISGISPVCYNGKNGYVELLVTGGTEPYRYTWNASTLDEPKIENLPSGTYTSTVTDANNCSFQNTFTLINPEQLKVDIPKDNYVLCLDQKLTLNGEDYSDPNVTYYWQSDKGFADKNSVVELEDAALYTITIANKDGCTNSDKFKVERSNEKIEASLFITSKGYNDESVVVVNGSLEYDSIVWNLPAGAVLVGSDDTYCEFDIKDNGLYNVGITSLKGQCSAYAEKPISIVDRPYLLQQDSVNYTTLIHTLDVYPIPTSDIVNVKAELYEKADLNVRLYNLLSNLKVYEERHDNKSLHEFQIDLTPSPAGVYILLIETKRDKKVIRVMKQ